MSKISLSPSPTGSAVYTIASPAGSTDRTLNLPDSAGTVATAESTLEQFNVTGSAPVFACRAFVNFNGDALSVRASGNVSSVSQFSTGNYAINFATALPDANYAVGLSGGFGQLDGDDNFAFGGLSRRTLSTASAARVIFWNRVSNTNGTPNFATVSIFR